MSDSSFQVQFDESKDIETIYDFHNAQIFRVNTLNTDRFLAIGKEFDFECQKRVDDQGRVRIIYITDQIPPLTSILQFMSNPFDKVKWGIYAIIVSDDLATLNKITPIITYGIGITGLKNKFALKVFEHKFKSNLEEVINWMDQNMQVQLEAKMETGKLNKDLSR